MRTYLFEARISIMGETIMEETIAAIATAYGEGGIGIVRISGPEAFAILSKVFQQTGSSDIRARRVTYGKVIDKETGNTIDEALAIYMKAPASYTGEDVVELQCHGSVVSLRKTLSLVLRNGARLAEPGEFTKRAFLNGRIDLSQAEAVMDVVKAKTDRTFDVAISQLEGSLSGRINEIRVDLLDLLVNITVNIDYPDEDIEEMTYEGLETSLSSIGDDIDKLLSTTGTGRMIREGLKIAIIGRPNVGKSSLMNCLLKESRAIVTEIPGTTRDTIEEALTVRGIPVFLTDTAGIRQTGDVIEQIGIEKAKEAFNNADFIIDIIDGSSPLSEEDRSILEYIGDRKALILLNKKDVGTVVIPTDIKDISPNSDIISTSLLTGEGVDEIEDKIEELVYGGQIVQQASIMVTNVRHEELLRKGKQAIRDALALTERKEPLDIIEIDVRSAYDFLGEITGETVTDEILDEVFSRFCLGK